ncbi:MAG TPA: hypothetical protein VE913_20125 [Longimicrobium sp.]|nr:hypothetical protein [Longimicrobium sp.]
MSFRTRTSRSWLRAAAVVMVAAGAAPLASCTGDVLSVQDPDIINPGDVRSTAGADAVRLGALARLNTATSGGTDGGDNIFLLGGMFADEWINGDSFIARQEIDQRVITPENSFLTASNRSLHRARLAAEQAVALLAEFSPAAPAWQVAEMHFVQAYVVNLLTEHYCSGLVFSTVVDGREQYGTPVSTTAAFERALKHADDGLALLATGTTANDVRVRSALQVTRGRILMNLNRPADAAAAVTAVAVSFRYQTLHSQTTESNYTYLRNNLNRRYSVGNGEGTNGINFATARDPRVPVCEGGDAACRAIGVTQTNRDDLQRPFHVQMLWPARETPVTLVGGIEAQMIVAEAQLRAAVPNPAGALATLNAARATVTGLAPLTDAGTDAARASQLFRERAFWLFGRGHRVGDLRRLVRQYGRPANTVFPTGAWHKNDGAYGSDVTLPIPTAERNNPSLPAGEICLSRTA